MVAVQGAVVILNAGAKKSHEERSDVNCQTAPGISGAGK